MLERALTGCSLVRRAEAPIGDVQVVRHVFESGFANFRRFRARAPQALRLVRVPQGVQRRVPSWLSGGRVVVPDLGCPRLGQGRG